MLESAVVGAVAFASTNIDDILLLGVFFGQAHARVWSIVIGQFVGIAALVVASLVAALAALAVPPQWLAWLGLLPLALGLRLLVARNDDEEETRPESAGMWTVASVTMANGADIQPSPRCCTGTDIGSCPGC